MRVRKSAVKELPERVGNINVSITCHGQSNSLIHLEIVTFVLGMFWRH